MIQALAVAALWLAANAQGASPSQRPRTLQEVIELTMEEGQPVTLRPEAAAGLGLPSREFPMKRLRYKQAESPDRREHTFCVLLEKDEAGVERPVHLSLSIGTGKKKDGVISVDATSFLLDLAGTLQAAEHAWGTAGEIETAKLELTPKLRKQAQAEITFHTKVAFALNLRRAEKPASKFPR